jgi:hypothetical protein
MYYVRKYLHGFVLLNYYNGETKVLTPAETEEVKKEFPELSKKCNLLVDDVKSVKDKP